MSRIRRVLVAGALALAAQFGSVAMAQTVRVVMHSDLKVLDPVLSTAYIVRNHGYMIFDQLFAIDEKFEVKPQMVDTWEASADGLVWTFKLRDGLEWHDGQPVTAEDCIASIKRFAKRDSLGLQFASFVRDYEAVDARTFRIVFKERFGAVLETLGKASLSPLLIMPKRIAETDIATQIKPEEMIGSGPFVFRRDLWQPGVKVVYDKNPRYKPRAEPPSGLAGGKVVHVDRVEWVWIPDPQTQVNALMQGEIDAIETIPIDLLPLVEKDPAVQVGKLGDLQYFLRMNWLHPPFNDARIRRAAQMALGQEDFLQASVGDPRFFRVCKSLMPCGTPLADETVAAGWIEANAAKARELLKEAGYDGTPVVILGVADVSTLANLGPVAKAQLERGGFKVDLQTADWQSTIQRIRKKEPPAQGGWSLYISAFQTTDILNPLTYASLNTNCQTSINGWPCDDEMERLRGLFAREGDAARKKDLAAAIQKHNLSIVAAVPLGEFTWVGAARKTITRHPAPVMVFWGMKKQ